MGESKVEQPRASWLNPWLLGVSLHFAWVYLLFYNEDALGAGTAASAFDTSHVIFWGSGVFLTAVLAAFLAWPRQALALAGKPACKAAVPVAVCAGTLVTYWAVGRFGGAPAGMGPLFAGSLMTGAGSGVLACRWAHAFSRERMGVVLLHGLPVVACVVAVVETLSYFPGEVLIGATTLLPAFGAYALERAEQPERATSASVAGHTPDNAGSGHTRHGGNGARRLSKDRPKGGAGFFALLYACVFILGAVPSFITSPSQTAGQVPFDAVFCMVATFGVLALNCLYIALFHRGNLAAAALVPLVAVACTFIPSASLPGRTALGAFLPVGFVCLEALLFLLSLVCAKRAGASPVRTYALGRIVYMASDIFGNALKSGLTLDAQAATVVNLSVVFAGSVILLVAAMLLILASSEGFFVRVRPAGSTADEGTRSQPQGQEGTRGPDNGGKAEGGGAAAADPACAFAASHGLTSRETEVFALLMRGYSLQRIQDELCISKGTTSFHVQNVYAKCGVHSRQELIALYEKG